MKPTQKKMRVAIVTNVVPDYRYPIFKRLRERYGTELEIFVTLPLEHSCEPARESLGLHFSRSANLPWRTRHRTGTIQREPLPIPLSLFANIVRFRPTVVISGDLGLRSLVACAAAKWIGAQFVLWSEDIASSASGRSRVQIRLRTWLVKRAHAFLAFGAPARDYLVSLGADPDRIFACAQAIDNDYWIRQAETADPKRARQSLQLSGKVFLLVGRLLPLKGFDLFLRAWSTLTAEQRENNTAIIVGDGEQLSELRRLIGELGLSNVRLVGKKSQSDLVQYYAAADAFVFPSLVDVWGLVVNEALCFGLPVLGSRYAGSSQQLLIGGNGGRSAGQLIDPLVPHELADAIRSWANRCPEKNPQLGREIVSALTFEASFAAIESMLLSLPISKESMCVTQPT